MVFSSVGALSSSFWYNPFHVPSGRSAQRAVSALLFSTNKLPARSKMAPSVRTYDAAAGEPFFTAETSGELLYVYCCVGLVLS